MLLIKIFETKFSVLGEINWYQRNIKKEKIKPQKWERYKASKYFSFYFIFAGYKYLFLHRLTIEGTGLCYGVT